MTEELAPPAVTESQPKIPHQSEELAVAGRNAMKLAMSLTVTWTVALFVRFPVPRHLGPERFGLLNFADSFSGSFFSVVDLGVSTYIFREIPVRPKHATEFWGGVMLVRTALSAALFAVMAITLAASHHTLEMQATVAIYGLALYVSTYTTSVGALLQAVSRVDRVAISNVASKIVWGAGLGLAVVLSKYVPFLSKSLPLFAFPMLVSELVKLGIIYPEAHRALDLRLRVDTAITRSVLLASLPFFIASAAVNVGGKLNATVLEFVAHDHREVGWYGAAQNLASLTMVLSPLLSWVLMPLLARAKARSEEEVFEILRRTIEGLFVTVVPITLVVALGAEFWVRLAFHDAFDPAALSLRFLASGFILIYLAMALSTLLIMTGHSWSVSIISLCSVPLRPIFVILLAGPCARHYGPGGGALGAALAEIFTTIAIVAAHFIPIGGRALDRRLLVTGGKTIAVAAAVMLLDRTVLLRFGAIRLVLDGFVYATLALATRAVKISEITRLIRGLRAQRSGAA
jgi:O-antigen/teichoic acid export membrane protein